MKKLSLVVDRVFNNTNLREETVSHKNGHLRLVKRTPRNPNISTAQKSDRLAATIKAYMDISQLHPHTTYDSCGLTVTPLPSAGEYGTVNTTSTPLGVVKSCEVDMIERRES